jgi:hypothetical protein
LAAIASTEAKVAASCAHPADLADVRRRHISNARWAVKRMPPQRCTPQSGSEQDIVPRWRAPDANRVAAEMRFRPAPCWKKAGKADDWQAAAYWQAAACRQARAFKALQPILTAAMQQHDQLESQLATFLASAPKLAKRLAHWQAANP